MVVGSSNSKSDLRKVFKERMEQSAARASASDLQGLYARMEKFLAPHPGIWGVYHTHQQEIPFPQHLKIQGVSFVHPKVKGPSLEFLLGSEFTEGPYGILEPDPRSAVDIDLSSMVGIFIPALAYDHLGVRLGRGKGYYDRALAHYEGLKIGLVWDSQVSSDSLPCEEHDLQVDLIMTEQRLVEVLNSKTVDGSPDSQKKGPQWR